MRFRTLEFLDEGTAMLGRTTIRGAANRARYCLWSATALALLSCKPNPTVPKAASELPAPSAAVAAPDGMLPVVPRRQEATIRSQLHVDSVMRRRSSKALDQFAQHRYGGASRSGGTQGILPLPPGECTAEGDDDGRTCPNAQHYEEERSIPDQLSVALSAAVSTDPLVQEIIAGALRPSATSRIGSCCCVRPLGRR